MDSTTHAMKPKRFSDRFHRRRPAWMITLNLTPMIDIVFLLLFFFMVVSRFGVEGMLSAQLPRAATGVSTEIPRTPLRVRFASTADDRGEQQVTIEHFHEEPLSIATLAETLQSIRSSEPGFGADAPVHLIAEEAIAWQDVTNAYNAAQAGGYYRVYFVD